MAGTSRIDELRKKFDENPRRYFAPLANEYRKIGDFEQAIFICQEFLPQQPGHMSGHIVYGQALFESGRHDEARSVFETALALDPENLIALRHLGDIARARGDNETASAWYRRVLESDPRNDEIAAILTSLDAEPPAQSRQSQTTLDPASQQSTTSSASLSVESAISAATAGQEADATGGSADPIVSDPLTTAPAESSFEDIAKLFTSPAASTDDSLKLIHEGDDVLEHSASQKPAQPNADQIGDQIEKEEPPLGEPEQATPVAENAPSTFNLPFLESLTSAEPASPSPMASAPPPPTREPAPEPSAAFVTETMAELYVKQGHHEQALEVYRQLIQLHPNDAGLAARLRDLEGRISSKKQVVVPPPAAAVAEAGPTIREFLGSIAVFRPRSQGGAAGSAPASEPPGQSRHNEPASSTGSGSTVAGSLNALFADAERETSARRPIAELGDRSPPRTGDPEPSPLLGRPSTPAASELSLDHVFRHATPASGGAAHSSFSFDQFFSQQAQQDVAASDAAPSASDSAGLSDDIQQFNAWLEGLKKS